jgi:Mlc titration factor MtfA (ptsG expression regulator)
MKKLLAVVILTAFAVPALAQHHHWYKHPRPIVVYRDWMGPVVGGVVVGVVAAEAFERSKQQPEKKIVVCTEWREIQTSDGKLYRERACREE